MPVRGSCRSVDAADRSWAESQARKVKQAQDKRDERARMHQLRMEASERNQIKEEADRRRSRDEYNARREQRRKSLEDSAERPPASIGQSIERRCSCSSRGSPSVSPTVKSQRASRDSLSEPRSVSEGDPTAGSPSSVDIGSPSSGDSLSVSRRPSIGEGNQSIGGSSRRGSRYSSTERSHSMDGCYSSGMRCRRASGDSAIFSNRVSMESQVLAVEHSKAKHDSCIEVNRPIADESHRISQDSCAEQRTTPIAEMNQARDERRGSFTGEVNIGWQPVMSACDNFGSARSAIQINPRRRVVVVAKAEVVNLQPNPALGPSPSVAWNGVHVHRDHDRRSKRRTSRRQDRNRRRRAPRVWRHHHQGR